jgi:hypothetical protein
MASVTFGHRMLTEEREISGSMVEPILDRGAGDAMPVSRAVAAGTVVTQPAVVGVFVAIVTAVEAQPCEVDGGRAAARPGLLVTACAVRLSVAAGEPVACPIVVESIGSVPIALGVALIAGSPRELVGMWVIIGVTGRAGGRESQ